MAIALSQSEAQAKEEQKKRITSSGTFSSPKASSNPQTLDEKVFKFHIITLTQSQNINVTLKSYGILSSKIETQL